MNNYGFHVESIVYQFFSNILKLYISDKRMGCMHNGSDIISSNNLMNKTLLTVSTLNYCGIMNSPFEFYCFQYEKQLKDISNIFLSLIPKYVPNFNKEKFKWQMGKIDLKIRIGRYSTMFQAETGIEKGRFIGKTQFQKKWDEVFEIQCKKNGLQFKQSEKQTTRLYDFIMYHTMLKYVYKVDTVQQAFSKDPSIYLKQIKPFFELSFFKLIEKSKKIGRQSFQTRVRYLLFSIILLVFLQLSYFTPRAFYQCRFIKRYNDYCKRVFFFKEKRQLTYPQQIKLRAKVKLG